MVDQLAAVFQEPLLLPSQVWAWAVAVAASIELPRRISRAERREREFMDEG